MEFQFTPGQEGFRREVQDFLKEKLAPRNWIAPAWPKEYGGAGMSLWEQVIFNEETAYARAPNINLFGVGLVGPTIILFGTEGEKEGELKGITSGGGDWG